MSSIRQEETELPARPGESARGPALASSLADSDLGGTRSDADSHGTVGFSRTQSSSDSDIELSFIPRELADHPRYRVLRKLGAGGMGDVFLAEHRVMMRPVAIKTINPALVRNEQLIERFRREIRAAAALAHPNIVAAFDAEQAGNLHFLVMEFVEGTDLSQFLRDNGPLTCAKACHYVRQAAIGLQHAFEKGMAHRDIKPHNLILAAKNQIKILDFGLARVATEQTPGDGLTEAGSYMGTADYIAPEQASDARSADIRADIYSLGCTMYQLLAGRVPFEGGSNIDKIVRHVNKEPTPIEQLRPDIPPELAGIIRKMMAKDVADRYQQPIEVAKAIEPIQRMLTSRNPNADAETMAGRLEQKTPSGSMAVVDRNAKTDPPKSVVKSNEPAKPRPASNKPVAKSSSDLPKWVLPLAGCAIAGFTVLGVISIANRPTKPTPESELATAALASTLPEGTPNATSAPDVPTPPKQPEVAIPKDSKDATPDIPSVRSAEVAAKAAGAAVKIIQAGKMTVVAEASRDSMKEWIASIRGRNKVVNQLRSQTVGGKPAFFAIAMEAPRVGNGEIEFDLTAEQLPDRIANRKASGMRARSVTAYLDDGKTRYAVLWGRLAILETMEIANNLTFEQYQELGAQSNKGTGWLGLQGYNVGDGERYLVYRAKPAPAVQKPFSYSYVDRFRTAVEKMRVEHREWIPQDISMWNVGSTRRFTVAFMANPRKLEWMADYDIPSNELAELVRAQTASGWVLRHMAANEKRAVPQYCMVWTRRGNNDAEPAAEPDSNEGETKKNAAKKRGTRKKQGKN